MPSSKVDPSNSESAETGPDQDDQVITMDRRNTTGDRRSGDPNASDVGVMSNPRRKKQRRRHIDPTTCERDYSDPEIEFMRAMDDYKRKSGRMFPTCSEVLEVVRDLGYVRLTEDQRESLGLSDLDDTEEAAVALTVTSFDDEQEVDDFDS